MSETQNDKESEVPVHTKVDLDTILINEIGQFGWYQVRTLALATIGVIFSAFHAEYLFTTARITTRCLITECEDTSPADFVPSWIYNAIPPSGGSFDNCLRYGNATYANVPADGTWNDTCPAAFFDATVKRACEQLVYEHTQTVVYDFDLGCDEWRRSYIGFVRTFGTFAALPFTGYISDRWGRRTALALNCFNTAWIGLTRYWVTQYNKQNISLN